MQKILATCSLLLLLGVFGTAQSPAKRQQHYLLTAPQHLALAGYDAVSYFGGVPKKGSAQYTATHEGVTYRFSSAANRTTFLANPAKYEPAFGGWCAYAMATSGDKVEVDPETFKIVNGRLLLFYNAFFTNTLDKWNSLKKPEATLLKNADLAWQKHLAK